MFSAVSTLAKQGRDVEEYLERILAQCRVPRSENNPRLMSPMLTIPTSAPLSTTGMRRKFLRHVRGGFENGIVGCHRQGIPAHDPSYFPAKRLRVPLFHLDKIPAVYVVVGDQIHDNAHIWNNGVAMVRIQRQQDIAQGDDSNELIVSLDNRNGPTAAVDHFHHGRPDRICLIGRHETG
jgi:hypothetical protein